MSMAASMMNAASAFSSIPLLKRDLGHLVTRSAAPANQEPEASREVVSESRSDSTQDQWIKPSQEKPADQQRRRALIELPLDGTLLQIVPAALIAVCGIVLTIAINNEAGLQAMREQQGVSNERPPITRERGLTSQGLKW